MTFTAKQWRRIEQLDREFGKREAELELARRLG